MEDYLDRFKAMVEELREHPDVVVTHFNVFPPVSERAFLRARHEFGAEIPEDFLKFYRQTNGLQLRWLFRGAVDFDAQLDRGGKYSELSYRSVYEDNGSIAGCINIQPMKDIFGFGGAWEGIVYFEEAKDQFTQEWLGTIYPNNAFRKSMKPIDYYNFYYSILLLTIEKPGPLPILSSSGYFKNIGSSAFASFEDYMEFILAAKGLVSARQSSTPFIEKKKTVEDCATQYFPLDLSKLKDYLKYEERVDEEE